MSTVLVVDDESDIRLLLGTVLSAAGFEVVEAEDGEAALTALRDDIVDVVILDLMMPVMDGWAVLWTLHDAPEHPPVIVMSARPPDAKEPPLGAVGYLHKPFPLEDAVEAVNRSLLAAS